MTQKYGPKTTADEVLSGVDLKGKRFLITGVSSGIGLETARSLVSHGASVVVAVRDLAKAEPATAKDEIGGYYISKIARLRRLMTPPTRLPTA